MEARIKVKLESFAHRGEAIGRVDGKVVFVVGGIPGEEVELQVFQHKPDYLRASLVQVLASSPDRTQPRCPHFGECGGCQLQHVLYPRQLELKRAVVVDQLRRLGGFAEVEVRPTLGMDDPWEYRNHARFTAMRDGRLAFTRVGSRRLVPITYCHIMHRRINETLAALRGHCRRAHNVSVRYGTRTDSLLISPGLDSPGLSVSTGQTHLEEVVGGHRFRVAASSFFQVNTQQADVLARVVEEELDPGGDEVVVDAYCGVGTFGIVLAPKVRQVIGIEDSAAALADAEYNARGLANLTFLHGATEAVLPTLDRPVDAVVLDPPRVGCRPEVLDALEALAPARLIYVSCDPATLARDLRVLVDRGFRLLRVQPIDLFPHTYHIEIVAALAK